MSLDWELKNFPHNFSLNEPPRASRQPEDPLIVKSQNNNEGGPAAVANTPKALYSSLVICDGKSQFHAPRRREEKRVATV